MIEKIKRVYLSTVRFILSALEPVYESLNRKKLLWLLGLADNFANAIKDIFNIALIY